MDVSAFRLWRDLCSLVEKHRKSKASEDVFQTSIEHCLEGLGWSKGKGEIVSHESVRIGSSNTLVSDIVLYNNNKKIIVIELKKPGIIVSEDNVAQLFSYMRQWRLRFGLIIADHIELYFDELIDDAWPTLVKKYHFRSTDEAGTDLINHLIKKNFSVYDFHEYCKNLLQMSNTSTDRTTNISPTRKQSRKKSIPDDDSGELITNREFWDKFLSYCEETNQRAELYKYTANNSCRLGVPVAKKISDYRLYFNLYKGNELQIGILAYNDAARIQLLSKLPAIESYYGESLQQDVGRKSNQKAMPLITTKTNIYQRDTIIQSFDWFIEHFHKLHKALQSAFPEAF